MNTNPNHKPKTDKNTNDQKPRKTVNLANEFLWALIGLLLTIFSTFLPAFTTNVPWTWSSDGVVSQPLGVTYQIGAVLLTGCLGGKNAGALAQIAYVILGLTWLPVFAHGGDWEYLKEPSFGYILGFIPGAWVCGLMAFRTRTKIETLAFSAICGLLVIHLCGLVYLIGLALFNPANGDLISLANLPSFMLNYSLIPIPGQLVIVCVITAIAYFLRLILFY
ncbi:BioY protein [Gloeothece citriformis PCC 7424]|uniref:Biotin transporter n=1 Tax=Gloeothece citriformis (strain PCC 7424) TaxID=65393 RepID=B7KFK0_GLOC7|nr:biotin transporter BioY [Gloeothece citriformis]ACK73325.1 BioY protein [Gloeothece citriformis PCC 7424]